MKTLLLLSGLPGSGKSFFARGFEGDPSVLHVEEDAVREELCGTARPPSMKEVREAMYQRASAFYKSHDRGLVILDAAFLLRRDRLEALDRVSGYDMAGLLWFSTPLALCEERNGARPAFRRVPASVFAFLAQERQALSTEEENRLAFVYHYAGS